jgi:glycosyltransferase involved in cell wall biosynthesis
MSLFSVVIATFNRVALLSDTLKSVLAQPYRDFEIIVVDDGSTDGTIDYLRSLENRVKAIRQANQGPGAARNRGAQHANGIYLAFLDSDDLWFPWTLEVYRDVVHQYNYPAFVMGTPYVFPDDGAPENATFGPTQTETFTDFLASNKGWWGASAFVTRRDVFTKVGGFNTGCIGNEDVELILRLGAAPGFVQITSPVTFAYRNHAGSLKSDLKCLFAGVQLMVRAEQAGEYPGGLSRAIERRHFLTRHTRQMTHIYLAEGDLREACTIYRSTFRWNVALGRVRYILAIPLLAFGKWVRRRLARSRLQSLRARYRGWRDGV